MMTKTQFAKHIVENFALKSGLGSLSYDDCPIEDLCGRICESSSLAVALNFLGHLKRDEDNEYALSRGGVFVTRLNPKEEPMTQFITVAELLQLLPDKI